MNMIPMPSPAGTNRERRYLPASFPFVNANPTMAMDAALSPSTVEQVLRFVSQKLSPQDFAQVRGLLTVADDPMVRGTRKKMYSPDLGNNKRVPWSDPDDKLNDPSYGMDSYGLV
jgi:hypothetical protein